MVKGMTWVVIYNAENRPVNWQCGATNIVMKYDYMGRRVEYIETTSSVTNAHHKFVYDGYLQLQRLNGSDNSVDLSFEWDPTEPVATRPLFMQQRNPRGNPSNYFFTHDGNKNVSDVVSYQRARGVVAHYDYAPFGAVTSATGPLASINPFRFSSEYHDDTLGLVYYNYRHYNPKDGRWCARDKDFLEEPLYVYCSNGAICKYDVLGMVAVKFMTPKSISSIENPSVDDLVEISSVDNILIDDRSTITVGRHGAFYHDYMVVEDAVIVIMYIQLNAGELDEVVHDDATYFVTPHDVYGNGKDAGSHVQGNYYYPYGAVLAHEKGHAQGFWDIRRGEINETASILSPCVKADDDEILDIFVQGDSSLTYRKASNEKASNAEMNWFRSQGFKERKEDGQYIFSK